MAERWTQEMLDELSEDIRSISESVKSLGEESNELNLRLTAYQMSSQQVINLAFGLLATATIWSSLLAFCRYSKQCSQRY